MEPVPRTIAENFEYIYRWIRRLDRRLSRPTTPLALQSGGRLAAGLTAIDDMNDALASGWYVGEEGVTANLPGPGDASQWFVQTLAWGGGWILQEAQSFNATFQQFRRTWNGSSWGPWQWWQLASRDRNINPATGALTLGNGTGFLREWVSGGVLTQMASFTLGTTSSVSGDIRLYMGWGNPAAPILTDSRVVGNAWFRVAGASYLGQVQANKNIAYIRPVRPHPTNDGIQIVGAQANRPAPWGDGDYFEATWSFPLY